MSYTFSATQLAEIQRLFDADEAQRAALGDANTNYADVYAYIRDSIPLYARLDPAVDSSFRWFSGAVGANENIGPFATFIRSYTEHQAVLRGVPLATGQMQIASNTVARNAIGDILNPLSPNYGVLPAINDIATNDARGVGEALFRSALPGDSAGTAQNSAWAGALLFSGLGSDQTWRLLGSSSSTAQLDRVDDLKNLLFAYDSFKYALDQTTAESGSISGALTFLGFSGLSDTVADAISAVFGSTVALPYMEMIYWLGPEKMLDVLRKINDPNAVQDTTSANFAQRATDLFYGASGLSSDLQIQSFDSLDPADLATRAQNDLAYRYTLTELNPFAVLGVDYSAHNVNGSLDLYDPATGTGELTADYLTDRSRFAVLRAQSLETATPNLFQSVDYFEDISTNTTIGISVLTSKFIFGGTENDNIEGGLSADHLYGMGGNDILQGGSGNDYLEGGKGVDTLQGGTGYDTYFYKSDDGLDIILDGDGQGQIKIDNLAIIGGDQNGDTRVFKSADGKHSYVFLSGDAINGGDVLVDNAIIIKNTTGHALGTAGDLGLTFADAVTLANPVITRDIVLLELSNGRAANDAIAWRIAA